MAGKKVTVSARFKAREGLEEKVKREIMARVAPTRAEAGCINYDLHQSSEDKRLFMLYENWTSKQALDEHLQMPYLKTLIASADELFSEPIDISLWEMTSEPE
jgi:quinol monooxygenase YgiN